MPIIKTLKADNGVTVAYHRPTRLEVDLQNNVAIATVNSHSDEAAALEGLPVAWQWKLPVSVDLLAGEQPTLQGEVELLLTTGESFPFHGGEIVADASETLETAKARAWNSVKRQRDAHEAADFEFEGGMYQADKARITGAVIGAVMAQMNGVPFSEEWTLADDSVVELSGAQVLGMGAALIQRVSAIFETARTMRVAIAAATSPAAAYEAAVWPQPTPTQENLV